MYGPKYTHESKNCSRGNGALSLASNTARTRGAADARRNADTPLFSLPLDAAAQARGIAWMLQTISAHTASRKPSAQACSLIRFEDNGGSVSEQVARSLTASTHGDNVCSPGSRARSHVEYTVTRHPVFG
ncbi:hypothetical protein MRX96_009819 [Rhipicephalus microplus]